jgi:hypothetical protein
MENIKAISVHNSKHLKPRNDNEFGHYLAGLIDSIGHFSSKHELVIQFSLSDISLAYYIKKRLGYGKVKQIRDVCILIVSKKEGLKKIIELINGKLRTVDKYNQVTNYVLN